MRKHELGYWAPGDIEERSEALDQLIDGPRYYSVRSSDNTFTAVVFEQEGPSSSVARITPAFTALGEVLEDCGERGEAINCLSLAAGPDASIFEIVSVIEGELSRMGLVRSLIGVLDRLSELSSDQTFIEMEMQLYNGLSNSQLE